MLLDCEIVNCVRKRIDESKQIPNYSNYVALPNEGLVYSLKRHRYIGNKHSKTGYRQCTLYGDNGSIWDTSFHRFIYEAVYGPIPEGLQVNHINEIKTDNRIENLNLMTHKENCNWGTHNERVAKSKSKTVGAFLNGELKITFPSATEAGRNGFHQGAVRSCCLGERQFHRGYEWRYIETEKVSI